MIETVMPQTPRPTALRRILIACAQRSPILHSVLARALPWSIGGATQDRWDQEYRNREWDRLREGAEAIHYEAIVYLAGQRPRPAILDLGCGFGQLLDKLTPAKRGRYVGVDFSAHAIAQATALKDADTDFDVADIARYEPRSGPFDIIVFNEVLQYFDDPKPLLLRYRDHLTPGGSVIVSLSANGFRPRLHMIGHWHEIARLGRLSSSIVIEADKVRWEIRRLTFAT
jgi:SAM-dependent methyltransferase